MSNAYGNESALLHLDSGEFEAVTIHDRMFGKHGYGGIIRANGEHEFVETILITLGKHEPDDCEACEHIAEINNNN